MVLCSTQARKIAYVLPDILALLKHEDTDLVYLVLVLLVRILQRIDRLLDRRTAKNMAASLRPLFQHVRHGMGPDRHLCGWGRGVEAVVCSPWAGDFVCLMSCECWALPGSFVPRRRIFSPLPRWGWSRQH